jgi:hypothetical protein
MMKKIILMLFISLMSIVLMSCEEANQPSPQESYLNYQPIETDGLILEEQYRSFMFFWETSNRDPLSAGYGMSRDRFPNANGVASIASVGYALAGLPIGINNEWITYDEGYEHASMTMDTLIDMENYQGFYHHFISMDTTERVWNSEVSVIDTALLIVGVLVAGQFFGGELYDKAMTLYERIDWTWYLNETTNEFYMSYYPEDGYHTGRWHGFAEQLIMYVLGAGSKTYNTGAAPYNVMKYNMLSNYAPYMSEVDASRNVDPYYYAPGGELFIHQYSHAFIEFKSMLDPDGLDWYENARRATQAQYNFALDYQTKYRTVSAMSWGVSASDGPNGYHAYGTPPYNHTTLNFDGTVAPYASMASIIYLEEEVINTAYYFKTLPNLWGSYGFKAAFNLGTHVGYADARIDGKEPYYSPDVIGIDKGITMLMIENYRSGLIWEIFMDIQPIQDGLDALGFTHR